MSELPLNRVQTGDELIHPQRVHIGLPAEQREHAARFEHRPLHLVE
jgi:hypothetical protein